MKQRINACAQLLRENNCDAFLVSDPVNIAYLSGFDKPDGYLLITSKAELLYFTNFIYMQEAEKVACWKLFISNHLNIFTLVADEAKKAKLNRIGFESKHLPFLEYETFKRQCNKVGSSFLSTTDLIA